LQAMSALTEEPAALGRKNWRQDQFRDDNRYSRDGHTVAAPASVREYLKENMRHDDNVNLDWVKEYTIAAISENTEAGTQQIVVSIPNEVVLTDQYIDHEIKNFGRVFKRNDAGNSIRWLLYPQGENRVERKGGRLLVYIDRLQVVPGILDEKQKIMSEKKITRNIKNR